MKRARILITAFAASFALSCTGTTGYDLVSFYAAAAGPSDATAGQPYKFTTDRGVLVILTKAVMHVGAMYLDQSRPSPGEAEQSCTLPGTYVGEVRGGRDVDMLSPVAQVFPVAGDGSTIPAAIGQVWLTGGDVFAMSDSTVVLSIAGTAQQGTQTIPFSGDITIDSNRNVQSPGSLTPGANPLCEQRIIPDIPAPLTLTQGGTLLLHLDPKALFIDVDFTSLPPSATSAPSFTFTNDSSNQASIVLYDSLRAAGALYRFEWQPAAP